MRYLPLLLLLSACATSPGARTTYSQSAPVPEFEPAWTAPHTTGQPGYVSPEDVPRSPHKRALPQTPETMKGPAIWAGDEPKASNSQETPDLFGVLLPVATDVPHHKALVPAAMCSHSSATRRQGCLPKARHWTPCQ